MLYLTTPSTQPVRDAMTAGLIGAIATPKQSGTGPPPGAWYACDNGRFGKGWPGTDKWWAWQQATVTRYGAERCLWALAPDVPFDAAATLTESLPWLERIRGLGVPAAFAAQDGCEAPGMVPWEHLDVLFLAGSTEWKLSRAAGDLAHEAGRRGLRVHMGRVNSQRRLMHARDIGASTADGTFVAFGPDVNLPRVLQWSHNLRRLEHGVQFPIIDLEPVEP